MVNQTTRLLLIIIILHFTSSASLGQVKPLAPKKHVVTAYVGGFRGLVPAEDIDAEKLTHIIYAFVNCQDSMAVLTNLATDSINFRKLNALKLRNPDLKILISIGGWSWSTFISDAVLTPSSRKLFAQTSVDIVRQYKLDGVDIDWEYPAMQGEEDNIVRPEDKQNYTLMFKAVREELDKLNSETGKKYELTAAVGNTKSFIQNTEMHLVQQYLDYIYLMTYDFSGRNKTVGHHTNLYPSKKVQGSSAEEAVRDYLAAGVPAHKLGLGAAFYGKGWEAAGLNNNGLGQPRLKATQGGGYSNLKDNIVNQQGYKRFWDRKAKAPYLFNAATKTFITYDDEKSIKEKCKYIQKQQLAGIFFWEYFQDPKEYLITTINQELP